MVKIVGGGHLRTVFLLLLLSFELCTGGYVPYSPSLPAGSKCEIKIKSLHPTQFAVGYWEIDKRSEKVLVKSGEKLEKYLQEHVGKIVIGPGGEPYIIDRHHLACIMQRTGKSTTIYATVEANFRSATIDSFWSELINRKWVYLYDENGKGPLDPKVLPGKIEDLKNDPYRSIAWEVRELGGFHKTDDPFAEFQWANFFRSRIAASRLSTNMQQLVQDAMQLCHSSDASKLPGYYK